MNIPEMYELKQVEKIPEIGATGYRLEHKKTGARVICVDTEDTNKVFCITFRTTPKDSTGVPHITEHSVLCGSDKYPVKDPFIELAKGSLNTFLNAMTWPDKTAYPVASENERDFSNLMSVYMDAVFHPNTYKTDKILKQEGWHYEMESADSDLKLNGVVYNEMRGVYSDPDSILEKAMTENVFPGTTYAVDSGGDPNHIPELTQEAFLDFHRTYYHPSNSFIFLYGNTEFEKHLRWMDEEYLGKYDRITVDSKVRKTEEKKELLTVEAPFAVAADDEETGCIFSVTKIMDNLMDPVEYLASQVLGYALLNAPGAPIREALLSEGIGEDIYGGYDSGYLQPIFTVTAKNCRKEKFERFFAIICDTLKAEIEKGIDKKTLLAGINNIEFSLREADFGYAPRGLVYMMGMQETWIHDEEKAFIHLQYNHSFEKLKELVKTDYFEKLVAEKLLENQNGAVICLTPDRGRTEREEKALADRLAAYKATLSKEEIERIVRETKELRAHQEAPDTKEALETIPMLSLDEISEEPRKLKNEETEIAGTKCIYHNIVTSGIGYLDVFLPLSNIPFEDYPYLSILKYLYTQMSTKNYSYRDLSNELSFYTGGLGAGTDLFQKKDLSDVDGYFSINVRYLRENAKDAVRLLSEVFLTTDFSDQKRLKDLLSEMKSGQKDSLEASGNRTALRRAMSYIDRFYYQDEAINGIESYRLVSEILAHFDEKKEALIKKLQALSEKIFRTDGVILSFTGEKEDLEAIRKELPTFLSGCSVEPREVLQKEYHFEKKNEAFKTAGLVQYVALAGTLSDSKKPAPSQGQLDVMRNLLNLDYLWNNVRVKGGAYGVSCTYTRTGKMAFTSFRDPNLEKTYDVYHGTAEFLRNLELSERDMQKQIIGTVGSVERPMLPYMEGRSAFTNYLSGPSYEERKANRYALLHCTVEDLRALADYVDHAMMDGCVSAVGNEQVLVNGASLFHTISKLDGEKDE